jgi:hypothetical protein
MPQNSRHDWSRLSVPVFTLHKIPVCGSISPCVTTPPPPTHAPPGPERGFFATDNHKAGFGFVNSGLRPAVFKQYGALEQNILNILKLVAIEILIAYILTSCASLHAYGIVILIEYDGNKIIENEKNVVLYLENIVQNYNDYSIKAFDRKAISYKVQKTSSTTHSFYVIYTADGTYHTLSFSATDKWAVSEGAWAIDTETDIMSYADYLKEDNKWEVEEIITDNGIDTLLTAMNILSKIHSNITYYFRSKPNRNNNHDNCNTALLETLAENES